ncbi:DUF2187 family protein [Enterococcus sp. LJL51]|uniref:DUF2187 family protein n=1 Tax=Enterococcus sp. LJL51 TaxID=3416656 RepID=UPI003CF345EA
MSSFSKKSYAPFTLYQETSINQNYKEGQMITFYSELFNSSIHGILSKKYTNSCLVDISACQELSRENREKYNYKIVVNYKKIFEDI